MHIPENYLSLSTCAVMGAIIIDLLKEFSIALGLAFGINFVDITFLKKKVN
ncbi:hypothetical protein [Clostridium sp. BJN0013]|uniref:hypothetical protein n=1 Tax=Clostridium sp. BJN0013 TaxID=3236840 RepID=UPI0034C5E81C